MFGELGRSASSPNIFMILCFQLPGGHKALPYVMTGGLRSFSCFAARPFFICVVRASVSPRPFCAVGQICGRTLSAPAERAASRTTRRGDLWSPDPRNRRRRPKAAPAARRSSGRLVGAAISRPPDGKRIARRRRVRKSADRRPRLTIFPQTFFGIIRSIRRERST